MAGPRTGAGGGSPLRYFIDINVAIYATGPEHSYRAACRRVLEAVVRGDLEAVTSAEALYIYWRRGRPDVGLRLVEDLIDIFSPDGVLPVGAADVRRAGELLETLKGVGLSPRDCLHLAVMERVRIDRIISADADFDRVPGIVRLDPLRFG